ncbi:MAG: DUF882 domain-containing protein [Leptolyngbyaceae cyanobacterium SL_7_1]|nr:DUF882 domain-containing protein [Leptolyngbyaceae cyanobacterium SL_7_1]
MTKQILKITKDAVFKRRPEHLGHLPAQETYAVTAGTEFEIQSYAYADSLGDFDEHLKFTLKQGHLNGFNTWFVFNRLAEIEFDGEVVYPLEEQSATQILKISQDTILKRRPVQASELADEDAYRVTKGTTFDLHSYAYADARAEFKNHIKFAIDHPDDYIRGLSTWYVYEAHARVEFDGQVVYPLPNPNSPHPIALPPPPPKGQKIVLPGGKGIVYTDQPILAAGCFSWGEATHSGTRIPQTVEHVNHIIALATQLEKARQQIGKPFRITSWYRPEPWNSRVGGAKHSQHLTGKAVDVVVAGYSGRELGKQLMGWWVGGLGIYPGNRRHILHLDIGAKRHWGF